ncbi:MAG: polysaccharide deacetylase family protein [Candidatus Pacebacteria bacterium]|nr:polysaccharide deacetylase family protein [Candidatus Paceibacterota bacterium]
MKQKIRNILIYIFFFTGIPYLRFLVLRKKEPIVRVLALHDVRSEERESFIKFIDFLKEKFNIISPEDFENKNFNHKKINVLLTFDDGYKSWVDIVAPILNERELSALFFITSGFVETRGNVELEKEFCKNNLFISHRTPLSWKEVAFLVEKYPKNRIGGHTLNHVNLAKFSSSKQRFELRENKKILEEKIRKNISYCAYPFGIPSLHIDRQIPKIAKEVGFHGAFTTEINFTSISGDQFMFARTCLEHTTAPILSWMWIFGGYDIISKLRRI